MVYYCILFTVRAINKRCWNRRTWYKQRDTHVWYFLSFQSTNSILHLQKCTRTAVILSSVHEPDLFRSVAPILNHVQLLWELVITCEPIVVMANSPCVCSELVQSLVSLVWPLRFCSDFRPFFTIHDSEFKEYTARENCLPAVILGVSIIT